MTDILVQDQLVFDPLTPATRAERRMLLGVSGLGLAIVVIPLVPTKIAFLGIDFEADNQAMFLLMYALVVAFFTVAFAVYGWADYIAWRRTLVIRQQEYAQAHTSRFFGLSPDVQEQMTTDRETGNGPPAFTGHAAWELAIKTLWVRAVFEFVFPVLLAIIVLVLLVRLALLTW